MIPQPELQSKIHKDQQLIFSEDEEDMLTPQKREYNK